MNRKKLFMMCLLLTGIGSLIIWDSQKPEEAMLPKIVNQAETNNIDSGMKDSTILKGSDIPKETEIPKKSATQKESEKNTTYNSKDNAITTNSKDNTITTNSSDNESTTLGNNIKSNTESNRIAGSDQNTQSDAAAAVTSDITEESEMFYYEELTQEIKDRITGISYGKDCDVPYDELRYVKVLYWGFDDETHTGELIVNKAIADDIKEIFRELYHAKYPIERMVLVDEYDADDNKSMAADNTSAFNYRVVDGTNSISMHSYGLAIDINPLYNPYVRTVDGKTVITPDNGVEYADRSLDCKYYIRKDDICYQAFISRGFTWGGEWKSQKDYQHFVKKLQD